MRGRRRVPKGWLAHLDPAVLGATARMVEATGVVTTADLLVAAIQCSPALSAWWVASGGSPLQGSAAPREGSPAPGLSGPRLGVRFDPSAVQALGAVAAWNASPAETAGSLVLVVLLLDQGSAEVADLLRRSGIDPVALRTRSLGLLGLGEDHPVWAFEEEPHPAIVTAREGVLPISALDPAAWAACRRHQAELPLRRLRRRVDVDAMGLNEQRALEHLADRLGLDDLQRRSLLVHHLDEVHRLAADAAPGLAEPAPRAGRPERPIAFLARARRRRLRVPPGWRCWMGNRHVNWRARWLRLAGQR